MATNVTTQCQAGSDKCVHTVNHIVAFSHRSDRIVHTVNKNEQPLSSSDHKQCSEPSSPSVLEVGLDGLLAVVCVFFKSMDGLGQMEVGPDALPGPVGPYGIFPVTFLQLIYRTHKLEIHDFTSLIRYDLANCVMCVNK